MLDFNPVKHNCTGCTACYSVCPKACITMKEDSEGFLYPAADPDKCINCGLCEKVCPIANPIAPIINNQKVVAAVTNNKKIWKASASGGAFSEICNVWADNDTLIIGAAWVGMTVHHLAVKGPGQIAPLRKSKYIASNLENTYKKAQCHLKKGGRVIFSGTPCQIAGLRSFLRKDYDGLLTIDLICHGVGSPKVFQSCIKAIERQAGKKLVTYEFRAKRNSFEADYIAHLRFIDGSSEYIVKDQYSQLFLKQTCLRPSCGMNCKFRGRDLRPGDITIADCKGLTEIFPQLLGHKKNFSTIVTNTTKGESILESLRTKMKCLDYDIENVIKYNPLFDHQTWASKDRDKFFLEFEKDNLGTLDNWTFPYSLATRSLKGVIFGLLPMFLRKYILKCQA